MVAQPVRAIYEQGRLRLLDPVDLAEGQEIQLMIISERERARAALGDILVHYDPDAELDEPIDEAALLAEIHADTKGKPAISDAIIEERRGGP
jgi:predicted DNA-binding antitoxin AbrB/MazE fold protein